MNLAAPEKLPEPEIQARPILKWAGGKKQLLDSYGPLFAARLLAGGVDRYFEPFLGGAAVFFHLQGQGLLRQAVLSDVNPELVLVYLVLQSRPEELIAKLGEFARKYLKLGPKAKENYYYRQRETYNKVQGKLGQGKLGQEQTTRAALAIFLNKTCYNGLFRQNSQGLFNVPFGRYVRPGILNEPNLRAASQALGQAEIFCRDFCATADEARAGDFIYYDPPYRPLSRTSAFTNYAAGGFGDPEQERLAAHYATLSRLGVLQMLSNSDPAGHSGDLYLERLYQGFNVFRVKARRAICCRPGGRGALSELVITNYHPAGQSGNQ